MNDLLSIFLDTANKKVIQIFALIFFTLEITEMMNFVFKNTVKTTRFIHKHVVFMFKKHFHLKALKENI